MKKFEREERKTRRLTRIKQQKIADKIPEDHSPRIRSRKQISRIAKSLKSFSFNPAMPSPIRVLARDGEARRKVWRRLGNLLEEVANEDR